MTQGNKFVLDANVFIEAARRYYSFDLAPRFWESLSYHAEAGSILSIDRVGKELERGKDELARWAKREFSDSFAKTDEAEIIKSFREIMSWVQANAQFSEAAKADFADDADGWLVAFAKVRGYVVVTQEVLAPEVKKKIPIPNVCQAFDVHFVDTFEMLRTLGVRFS